MDPYSGRILAMSGGFSFKKSEFNRVSQASRQPGSAFKPFIYALALENNFTPTTLILDAPIVLDQGEDLKLWKPENYGKKFYGPSTLRTGVEKSRNLMTVRIAQNIGIKKIVKFANELNIYKNPEARADKIKGKIYCNTEGAGLSSPFFRYTLVLVKP